MKRTFWKFGQGPTGISFPEFLFAILVVVLLTAVYGAIGP